MGGSLNKSDKHFFLHKLTMQNLDEILLRKHCKKKEYVVTHFWPHKKLRKEREK
jgi:hypothetical protein